MSDVVVVEPDPVAVVVVEPGPQGTPGPNGAPRTDADIVTGVFNIRQTRHFLDTVTSSMRDDIMSGSPMQDHTAAVAAALADTTSRCMVFPDGGTLLVDRFHLNPASRLREFGLEGVTIKQRSDYVTGLGHFFRAYQAAPGYGTYDDIRVVGGTFDQNGKWMAGHLFWLAYGARGTLEDVSVKHRTAQIQSAVLDPASDVFTCVGHGWSNGSRVGIEVDGTLPSGALPSGSTYLIANATTDTFKLTTTAGGSIDFTDAGGSNLIVFDKGCWAFAVGGRDMMIVRPRVLNGSALYQDGVHVTHGDGIEVHGGHSESGDDAYAFGYEAGDTNLTETTLANVNLVGCYGRSNSAFLFKTYVSDPTRSVKNIFASGLVGSSGWLRNGGVKITDSTGTDARTDAPKIDNIQVEGVIAKVGSSSRVQTTGAEFVTIIGASRVGVKGSFEADSFAVKEWSTDKSIDVNLDLRTKVGVTGVVVGAATNSRLVTRKIRPAKNYAFSPDMEGATAGIRGISSGSMPTGWAGLTNLQSGISRVNILPTALIRERQTFGINLYGTASAANSWQFMPCQFGAGTSFIIPAVVGQTRRFRMGIALWAGTLNGCGLQIRLQERDASGAVLAATANDIKFLAPDFAEFEAVRTIVSASVAIITGSLSCDISNAAQVEISLGLIDPIIE
ncbi:hypothetical protein C3941_19855 [Kaistia algarum]|uniref:hypothetical protein n=1 Tax=Kaistia algarum TaxID=2083279 RepID=UPI000CE8551D|nr:hypothetical protein [Kaistia algarum]MCX5516248.1 hypothetical protein [Kaistia algarum]PPE78318.1 hypothetical protein C3941_19855 [Kaistia algarum]